MKAKYWEDTVMKDTWMRIKVPSVLFGSRSGHVDVSSKLEAQAEISFQAGYEQGGLDSYAVDFAEGKRTGIKEVVEWLETCELNRCCNGVTGEVYCRDYRVYDGEWQAKLNEWGV